MENESTSSLPLLPLPQSISELEALVKQFYGLNSPQQYTQIDTCLKAVQRTHGGFALADQLMSSQDVNVRFFGALTFTVKINRDWASLNQSEGKDLLDRLLFWFIRSVNHKDVPLVIRKLCSALVSVFEQTNGEWTLCIQHAIACLMNDSVVDYAEAISSTHVQGVVTSISSAQATACLWLGSTLMERLGRIGSSTVEGHRLSVNASHNTSVLLDLIEHCLRSDESSDRSLTAEAIKLLHTIRTSDMPSSNEDISFQPRLADLTLAIASQLAPDGLLSTISDLASDTINKASGKKLELLLISKLLSSQFDQYQQELQDGDYNEDNLVYGRLLMEIAGACIDSPMDFDASHHPQINRMLGRAIAFAESNGYPLDGDESFISEVLIFWSSYVEMIVDINALSQDEKHPYQEVWINQSIGYTSRVVEAFLKKLQFPPAHILMTWDKQTQAEFRALRRDFRYFSASAFTLLGTGMLDTLVNYLLRLWSEQDWQGLEMTLQCLKGVIEAFIETDTGDSILVTLLSSPIFSSDHIDVPINIRRVSIELVADCSPFFERQSTVPMSILEWLFQALPIQGLALPAAKAISAICDSCRVRLSTQAPALTHLYCTITAGDQQQSDVTERLALAVGSVIQASWVKSKNQPTRTAAMNTLDELLNLTSKQLLALAEGSVPQARDRQITTVQSLVNVARAFQEADSEVIDLEVDHASSKAADPSTALWISSRQHHLTELLSQILHATPTDGDLMEVICLLVRSGITDDLDNPFQINEAVLVCLVKDFLRITDRPRFLLETVSRWLRSSMGWVKNNDSVIISASQRSAVAQSCLSDALLALIDIHNVPNGLRDHAEHISSILEFISTFIPASDLSLLIEDQAALDLFIQVAQISVSCFNLPEPILKQAASTFWTKLLDLRSSSTPADTPGRVIETVVVPLLPALVQTLVYAISGLAARSDLDNLMLPFRRLIIFPVPRQQHASQQTNGSAMNIRSLLTAALSSQEFPSTRVNDSDKKVFVEKLLRLRGESAGTGRICKEWWVACRGTFS